MNSNTSNTGNSGLVSYLTDDETVHSFPNINDYVPSMRSEKIRARMRPLLSQPGVLYAVIHVESSKKTYIAFNPCPKCGETPRSIERYQKVSPMPKDMIGMTSDQYVYSCCPTWLDLEPAIPGNLRLQSKPADDLFQDYVRGELYRHSVIPPKQSSAIVITGV